MMTTAKARRRTHSPHIRIYISFLVYFYLSLFIYFVCSRCDVVLRALHRRYAPYHVSRVQMEKRNQQKKETGSEKNWAFVKHLRCARWKTESIAQSNELAVAWKRLRINEWLNEIAALKDRIAKLWQSSESSGSCSYITWTGRWCRQSCATLVSSSVPFCICIYEKVRTVLIWRR